MEGRKDDRWMDKCIDGWIDEWVGGYMDRLMHE